MYSAARKFSENEDINTIEHISLINDKEYNTKNENTKNSKIKLISPGQSGKINWLNIVINLL